MGRLLRIDGAPDMLPGSEISIIDWPDFAAEFFNPLGMPEAFSPALNLLTRNPITPEEERTAQAQIPELLAKRYGVHPDCVAVGASATDVLAAVANSFEPRSVAVPVPSRAAYERCLGTAGHRIVEVPGPDGFVVPDPQAVRRMGLSFDAAMLANPAFPTSRLLARQTLLDYLQACAWVIVDERGIDLTFGGESTATMIDEHSNLIVIRSLTDTFSLPGMPLSCALAHPAVASRISQIAKRPASAALSARLLKLATPDHHLERAREVLETEIPWMQCMPACNLDQHLSSGSQLRDVLVRPGTLHASGSRGCARPRAQAAQAWIPGSHARSHARGLARPPFLRERAHKVGQRAIHRRFAAQIVAGS